MGSGASPSAARCPCRGRWMISSYLHSSITPQGHGSGHSLGCRRWGGWDFNRESPALSWILVAQLMLGFIRA